MRLRSRLATAGTAALALGATMLVLASAASAAQTFSTPVALSNPPAGGEPSIATDPFGDVLVAGPQGIPSGVNGTPGTGLWISRNDGSTFAKGTFIGSYLGGGDDDIVYDAGSKTFYEADLEAAATEVCKSTDFGKTWTGVGPVPDPGHCTTINGGQAAPSDDRPWLAVDPTDPQRLYLVYHEFVSAQPLGFVTNNGGADDFANPCGPMITNPSIEANVPTDITGGTLVARPAVGKDGTLYVLFATTTQQENAQAFSQGQPSGTFSQLYLAVSHDHCQTFTDYTVFDGQSQYGMNTVQFGDIFNDLAIDGAGNLYVIGDGFIGHTPFATTTNVYLFHSTDHGKTWSKPFELATPDAAAMLPAAVGGPKAGQLVIGYFRTINGKTNPNDSSAKWTYSTAESSDATTSSPAFSYADVRPGYSYHNGAICNLGILCGLIPGQPSDRSLLDFTSVALDSHGCPLFTFAGNPTGSPGNNTSSNTDNFVARQISPCFSTATTSTKHPHKKHRSTAPHHKRHHSHHKKHHRKARRPAFTG
jgi:hypothetical protein